MKRGDHRTPPSDLESRSVTTKLTQGRFWRCANVDRPLLVDWDERSTSRFSSPGLPVLYLAAHWQTAFYEAFGDDLLDMLPDDRAIAEVTLKTRQWVEYEVSQDIKLLDVTDSAIQREIGADGSTFRANYTVTQRWSAALRKNPLIEGLQYASRLDDPRPCLAVYALPNLKDQGEALFSPRAGKRLSDDSNFLYWLLNQKIMVKS